MAYTTSVDGRVINSYTRNMKKDRKIVYTIIHVRSPKMCFSRQPHPPLQCAGYYRWLQVELDSNEDRFSEHT